MSKKIFDMGSSMVKPGAVIADITLDMSKVSEALAKVGETLLTSVTATSKFGSELQKWCEQAEREQMKTFIDGQQVYNDGKCLQHDWIENPNGTAVCADCDLAWTPITYNQSEPTEAGRRAVDIANHFRVPLDAATHVLTCAIMGHTPPHGWVIHQSNNKAQAQIGRPDTPQRFILDRSTLAMIHGGKGATVVVKKPPTFNVPIRTNVKQRAAAPERSLVAPTIRRVELPPEEE